MDSADAPQEVSYVRTRERSGKEVTNRSAGIGTRQKVKITVFEKRKQNQAGKRMATRSHER